jgi:hypothetical protein
MLEDTPGNVIRHAYTERAVRAVGHIHEAAATHETSKQDVDGRHKAGHDDIESGKG